MPLPASLAYRRFLRALDKQEALSREDVEALRAAADARLFGDKEPEGVLADADVRLLSLEVSGALSNEQIELLERRLHAIVPADGLRLAA